MPTRDRTTESNSDGDALRRNRQVWQEVSKQLDQCDSSARWARREVLWGLLQTPESDIGALGPVAGRDVLELGCGTAHLCAQLAREGAHPVGLDLSSDQLDAALAHQLESGLRFGLVEGSADAVPLQSCSFDVVVSEYGSAPWCQPSRWLAEAARLLRPGGRLVFLTNSVLAGLCVPADGGHAGVELLRSQSELERIEWPGGGIEHHPGHGDWIFDLRAAGFQVEVLHELRATAGAVTRERYEIVTTQWARRWPVEDMWVARRL